MTNDNSCAHVKNKLGIIDEDLNKIKCEENDEGYAKLM